mgnify:CR=1 FL=1
MKIKKQNTHLIQIVLELHVVEAVMLHKMLSKDTSAIGLDIKEGLDSVLTQNDINEGLEDKPAS